MADNCITNKGTFKWSIKKKQQEDFMKEMWDNYKVTNDIEYLARASEEAPFFGQSEMSLEIATKLRQLKSKINLK